MPSSFCLHGEPTGDETPIEYPDPSLGADCTHCADWGTRRGYFAGLGAHTLPCPTCRAAEYAAALDALRSDAARVETRRAA